MFQLVIFHKIFQALKLYYLLSVNEKKYHHLMLRILLSFLSDKSTKYIIYLFKCLKNSKYNHINTMLAFLKPVPANNHILVNTNKNRSCSALVFIKKWMNITNLSIHKIILRNRFVSFYLAQPPPPCFS